MGEWQPIETAPRDGAAILLWANQWCQDPVIGDWCENVGCWDTSVGCMEDGEATHGDGLDGPTHWMPLPEPP